jgi:hypothetical protein
MDFIKKNWLILVLAACLLGALGGLVFVGRELFTAQTLAKQLSQSLAGRDKLNIQLKSDVDRLTASDNRKSEIIGQLESGNKRLSENYSRLERNNIELKKLVEAGQGNDKQALEILATAIHH